VRAGSEALNVIRNRERLRDISVFNIQDGGYSLGLSLPSERQKKAIGRVILLHLPVVILSILFAGCSDTPPQPGLSTTRDSAGVLIVESLAPIWNEEDRWRLSDEPMVQIGTDPGDPGGQLWEVRGLVRMSDGRIVVLNGGSYELRLYGSFGRLLGSAGGAGGGPGEFEYPLSLTRLGADTLVVLDRMGDRVFFDGSGRFIREERMDPGAWMGFWGTDFGANFQTVLPDGSILARLSRQGTTSSYPQGLYRPRLGVVSVLPDLSETTHFGWYGGIEQEAVFRIGSRHFHSVPPFHSTTSLGTGGDPPRVIVADNEDYEIQVFLLSGELERIVRRTRDPEGIRPEEVEAWKEEQRTASWAQEELPLLERAWATQEIPDAKPAYYAAHIDKESNLWVQETLDPDAAVLVFAVFDARGQLLGTVDVPGGLDRDRYRRPIDIGDDYFLGIWRDEYDVESVRLYEVIKPMP